MIRTTPKIGQYSKRPTHPPWRSLSLGSCESFPCTATPLDTSPNGDDVQRIRGYSLYRKCDRCCYPSGRVNADLRPWTLPVPPWHRFRTDHYTPSQRKVWSSSGLPCLFPNLWPLHLGGLVLQIFCSPGCMPLLCWLLWWSKLGVSKRLNSPLSLGKAEHDFQFN